MVNFKTNILACSEKYVFLQVYLMPWLQGRLVVCRFY